MQKNNLKTKSRALLSRVFNRKAGAVAAAISIGLTSVFAAGCGSTGKRAYNGVVLTPVDYASLPGWDSDKHADVMGAFARSCEIILNRPSANSFAGKRELAGRYRDWRPACEALPSVPAGDDAAAKEYFEKWFQPWQAAKTNGETEGLFTGYYEAQLEGSLTKDARFKYPVYEDPGGAKKSWTRKQIMEGNWPHNDKAIAYVDDLVALYFMQVQGSGEIRLQDGTIIKVGYDGQNGYGYTAIGRTLVDRGHMKLEDVTMQTIREWLDKNPDKALDIIYSDQSFVFFKEKPGPKGGSGAILTPGRSLAIDHKKVPYHMPLWVDIEHPGEGEPPIRRVVIAQDTGGAIKGEIRGDFFWGAGKRAEDLAGIMGSGGKGPNGRYWFLLPK